jgi:hypothetical protein
MSRKMLWITSLLLILGLLLPMAALTAGHVVDIGVGRVTGGAAVMFDGYSGRVNVMVQYNDPHVRGFFRFRADDGSYFVVDVMDVTEMDPAYETGGVVVGARATFVGPIVDTNFPGLEGAWVEIRVDDRGTPGTGYNRVRWDIQGIGDTGWIVTEKGNLSIHVPGWWGR